MSTQQTISKSPKSPRCKFPPRGARVLQFPPHAVIKVMSKAKRAKFKSFLPCPLLALGVFSMTHNSVILWSFFQRFSQHAQFPLLYKYAWKKLKIFAFQNSHMENLKILLQTLAVREPRKKTSRRARQISNFFKMIRFSIQFNSKKKKKKTGGLPWIIGLHRRNTLNIHLSHIGQNRQMQMNTQRAEQET